MENNFDRFIRGKLNDRKFELKEAYWKDALSLIEMENRKNRDRLWLLIPFVLGALVFAIVNLPALLGYKSDLPVKIGQENQIIASIEQNNNSKNKKSTKQLETSELSNISTLKPLPIVKNIHSENIVLAPKEVVNNISLRNDANALYLSDGPMKELESENVFSGFTDPTKQPGYVVEAIPISRSETFTPVNALPLRSASFISYPLSQIEIGDVASMHKPKKGYINLIAGALYNPSDHIFEGGSFGVGFNYNVSPKWAIHSGIELSARRGDYGPSWVNSRINYSFGKEVESLKTIPDEFYYLNIPIYASRQFGRHLVGAGVNNEFLLSAYGDQIVEVDRVSDMSYTPVVPDDILSANDIKLPSVGLDKYEMRALLEYQYSFSSRMAIGSRALIGFPLKNNKTNFDQRIADLSGLPSAQLDLYTNPLEENGNHSLSVFVKYRLTK